MKYKGFTGKLLYVDLTAGKLYTRELPEDQAGRFIGGSGLAAKIIADLLPDHADPLHPAQPLVFMTGPLSGTIVPWSGRHCVAGISPLTGLWAEAYSGGTWARALKKAGFDGIVITGAASKLSYLVINDQRVSLQDATALQGLDTFETERALQKICGQRVSVATIGPAGEACVRFAAVMHDGAAARAAARCGLGAVMGAKNLKAIAVHGSRAVPLADRCGLTRSIEALMPKLTATPGHRWEKARPIFSFFADDGRPGIHNWRDGELPGFKAALLDEVERHVRTTRPYRCAGCRTGCVESNVKRGVRQTHWEAFGPLGPQCGITDMGYIQEAFDLCNRQGIDTISAGGVVSFAMECFEEGLITEQDTDGIRLDFSNGAGMLQLLEKICRREGCGQLFADGARAAAAAIGGRAAELALTVKGLEIPAHDPRVHNFMALAVATDNRGAMHTGAADPNIEGFDLMELDKMRFAVEGTAPVVARGQDYGSILNSLVLCAFSHAGYAQYHSAHEFAGLTARGVLDWLRCATGLAMDFDRLLLAGERIFNQKHQINLRRGFDPATDTLPARLQTSPRGSGPAAEHLPPIGELVADYYRVRGWLPDGSIDNTTLRRLGLSG